MKMKMALTTVLITALVALGPAVSSASDVPGERPRLHADVQEAPQGGHATGEGSTVQEHGPDSEASQEAHGELSHGDGGHSDEWGTDVMMHHVIDSNEIEFFGWTWHLPEWEPFLVGPFEVDMSPTKHTVFLWLATLLTIITVWIAARRFSHDEGVEEAPEGFLNFFETFYEYLRDEVALTNIGHGGERFVPYVVTLFFFILYANLLGLIPFGASATGNIMVTGALACISLVIVEASGYAALGPKGYLKTIFFVPEGLNPIMKVVMFVIMPVVELIGKLAKPFALAVRLFANMTAGHFVILALLGLILTYGGATLIGGVSIVGALALALFVMFLELFVAFLQAYIFTVLTAVFIGLIRHEH